GGGGGGDSSSGAIGLPPPGFIFDLETTDGTLFTCEENWVCGNWSICPIIEIQTRNCTDSESCGTYKNKPAEKQACVFEEELFGEEKEEEEKKPPHKESPFEITFPKIVCEKEINPLKNNGIWFFLIVIIVIFVKFII
ncbi:hypothetical protein ACFLTH_17600, partial [Bacteroidota bacterium]